MSNADCAVIALKETFKDQIDLVKDKINADKNTIILKYMKVSITIQLAGKRF